MSNPFDTATQVGKEGLPPPINAFYGEIEITAQYIKLVKGQGKQVWNDQTDSVQERRTEISINLIALAEMKLQFPVQRTVLAESREWTDLVWPSIAECGLDNAGLLHGKYVKAELVENGRTWEKNGKTVKGTSLKFLAVFVGKKACEDAYYADLAGGNDHADSNPFDGAPAGANGGNGTNPEKEVAQEFLKVLVKQAAGDKNKLATSIVATPIVSKYFTVDSPEVAQLMTSGS